MPQIIVKADLAGDGQEGSVMLRERVNVADFESDHFQAQLVERIGWAVNDADEVEHDSGTFARSEPQAAAERDREPSWAT
jgi:hypothetical protein